MRTMVVALSLVGCGRVSFDPLPDGNVPSLLTYRDAVMEDAPIAYYRLGSSTIAHDEFGNDVQWLGTCATTAGALAGDTDLAVQLGGTCYASLGSGYEFRGTAPYTLEMWIATDMGQTTQFVAMKETRTGDSPNDGYALVLDRTGMYGERVVGTIILSTDRVFVNSTGFTHVVYVYNGASLALYVDAVEHLGNDDARPMTAVAMELDLGGYVGIPIQNVRGAIDELAIYDHVLTQERISVHHDIGVNGPRPR